MTTTQQEVSLNYFYDDNERLSLSLSPCVTTLHPSFWAFSSLVSVIFAVSWFTCTTTIISSASSSLSLSSSSSSSLSVTILWSSLTVHLSWVLDTSPLFGRDDSRLECIGSTFNTLQWQFHCGQQIVVVSNTSIEAEIYDKYAITRTEKRERGCHQKVPFVSHFESIDFLVSMTTVSSFLFMRKSMQ